MKDLFLSANQNEVCLVYCVSVLQLCLAHSGRWVRCGARMSCAPVCCRGSSAILAIVAVANPRSRPVVGLVLKFMSRFHRKKLFFFQFWFYNCISTYSTLRPLFNKLGLAPLPCDSVKQDGGQVVSLLYSVSTPQSPVMLRVDGHLWLPHSHLLPLHTLFVLRTTQRMIKSTFHVSPHYV